MSPRILVIGGSGQVARELATLSQRDGLDLSFAGRDQLDLSHIDQIAPFLNAHKPDAVINAAAYTAVDAAETERPLAYAINRDAPGVIAQACAKIDAPLVHFSTDYVFDGTKDGPYVEDDPRRPGTIYGRSKSQGEDAVFAAAGAAVVLRTSWVFSAHGSNFVKTMLRLAATRDQINVVADQIGCPTWAGSCARAAIAALDHRRAGGSSEVFHLCDAGAVSWAVVARGIFAQSRERGGPSAEVKDITTAEYPTAAQRPPNSQLSTAKIERMLGWSPAPWSVGLAVALNDILGEAS